MARELRTSSVAESSRAALADGGTLAPEILNVPNALSLLRVVLIAPFLAYYFRNQIRAAAVIFALAAVSDLLDGALARLLRQRTVVGAVLDPLADKLLALASLAALVIHHRLPLWLLLLSLLRDSVVLVIALLSRWLDVPLPPAPSRIGKYATFFTNGAVVLALLGEISYAPRLSGYVFASAVVAGECLVAAAIQYGWRFVSLWRSFGRSP